MTNGGADYCFECIGLASMMLEAYRSSRVVALLFLTYNLLLLSNTNKHI